MASSGAFTTTMNTMDGALRLWREIVRGLEAAGYASVVPEYLKLSRSLSQVKMTELLQGVPESDQWMELRNLAMQALKNLDPLLEAARILAQLPCELRETVAMPSGMDSQVLPASEPDAIITDSEPEPPVLAAVEATASPAAAARKRRSPRPQKKSFNQSKSKAKKAVVTKSKVSASRRRVKSRD